MHSSSESAVRGGRRIGLRTAVCGLAILLTACVAGPDFKTPADPAADRYTAVTLPNLEHGEQQLDADGVPAMQWWKVLQCPRLDALVRQALAVNHTLAAARATLAAAQALGAVSEAERYPNATLSAMAGRQKYGVAFIGPQHLPPFSYYSVGPNITYALDFSGGIRRAVERQDALIENARQEMEAAALSVSGNVVQQALAAASARSQMDWLNAQLDDDRTNLKLIRDAVDAGSATRVDVLAAETQLASDQTFMPPLRRALSAANHQLAVLIGRTPADWVVPDFRVDEFTLPPRLPLAIPSALVHRRPDLRSVEAQLHAATAAVGIASADLYPRISITANGSLESNTLGALFDASGAAGGLAANLVAPIFNHGALHARKRAAAENLHAALEVYQQTVLRAFAEVADALEYLDEDQDAVRNEQAADATAIENLALTRESYQVGNTSVLQVLEAQRQSGRARVELLRARAQRLQDTVDLLLAVGGPISTD